MNAQIAQHLNIAKSNILRVEKWATVLFIVVRGLGARFVSKKVVKMSEPMIKPQNQIPCHVKKSVVDILISFFLSYEISPENAEKLGSAVVEMAIEEQIQATHPTAANVFLSDSQKIERLEMAAKTIAQRLDEKDELEKLL